MNTHSVFEKILSHDTPTVFGDSHLSGYVECNSPPK